MVSREIRLISTFHFPEIMLNIITRSTDGWFAVQLNRCSGNDSLAMYPEDKVVFPLRRDRLCRIRKARKTHLRDAGEVVAKA